ncbi:MAG: gamma-glutamyl-gamma-aminobutyrate hydrolase family protein, partial [Alphaproteobacteria bacterium]|nr:gamma-glutamyl-gamma-aminobutyrate hydrolase family protein [Alphaproteobacteria bacterium]
MKRPVIGVTTSHLRGWRSWQFQRLAIWRAGGQAKRLTASRVSEPAVSIKGLDGLVIGGGDDIDLTLYGGTLDLKIRYDPERDALERALLQSIADTTLPILGVCRGAQMLALWRNGSLIQDVYAHYPDLPRIRTVFPRLSIEVKPDSRLADILGRVSMRVNSLHHQSIDNPGRDMRIVACDRRGVTQAIEHTG